MNAYWANTTVTRLRRVSTRLVVSGALVLMKKSQMETRVLVKLSCILIVQFYYHGPKRKVLERFVSFAFVARIKKFRAAHVA